MFELNTPHGRWLERWSPTLFLAGGAFLVPYAALFGVQAFTGSVIEQNAFKFGYVLGFLGLLGLYSTLTDQSPSLARAGGVAAILGLLAISVFTLYDLAVLAGLHSGDEPAWYAVFIPLALIGFTVGYLAFGTAVLRSEVHSRGLGVILLTPGLITVVMLATILTGFANDVTAFVVSTGEAMAHLAIGTTLRTNASSGEPTDRATASKGELVTHD
jgi:hypothetical protein